MDIKLSLTDEELGVLVSLVRAHKETLRQCLEEYRPGKFVRRDFTEGTEEALRMTESLMDKAVDAYLSATVADKTVPRLDVQRINRVSRRAQWPDGLLEGLGETKQS